jgi:signal transduction histidine kinase
MGAIHCEIPAPNLYRNIFAGAMLSGIVSSAIILALVQKSLVERIIRLTHSFTNRLPGTERFSKLPVDGNDELAEMTRSINKMLESLKEAELLSKHQSDEIKRLNKDLERQAYELAASNQELESFSYTVSHDMRSPLTRISGYCQIMLESRDLEPEQRQYLNKINEAATWLNRMLDSLLILSRVVRTEMTSSQVDLSSLANSAFEEAVAESTRQIKINVEPGLTAFGDPSLLRILLFNLAGNAIKYSSQTNTPEITVGMENTDRGMAFFVRDNGIGFEQKEAERIFTPFIRLNRDDCISGNGIGLSTVRRIAHRHHGQVWACSTPNRGATFFFILNQPPQPDAPLFS